MELWNAFEEEKKYSLVDIIKIKFKAKYLEEKNINSNMMTKMEMEDELQELYKDEEIYDDFLEKEENYIGNEVRKVSSMIDLIIGTENRKMIYKNRAEKVFDAHNCIFISFIMETYHLKDSKLLRKGKISNVSDQFLDYLYRGMKELAENADTRLTVEIVKKRWNAKYSQSYRRFLDSYFSFDQTINKFVNIVMEQDEKDRLLSEIEYRLDVCLHEIGRLDDKLLDAMIIRNDFGE